MDNAATLRAKATENEATAPTGPVFYRDSIQARAAPIKYRKIGNPYGFLNSIGIEAILDEIRKGHNIVEIAESLDISIGILLNWIDNEGHTQRIENAFQFSAEGYLAQAAKQLKEARNDFELKRAKEIATHGRFMASKLDRNKYGAEAAKGTTGNLVSFVLHIGTNKPQEANIIQGEVLRKTTQHAEIVSTEDSFALFPTPPGVVEPDSIGPFEDAPLDLENTPIPTYIKNHLGESHD